MILRVWAVAATAAVALSWSGSAHAHEFRCEKRVNGEQVHVVTQYPSTLRYDLTVTNTHPADVSEATRAEDALLGAEGYAFTPAAPFALGVGESVGDSFTLEVADHAECLALAARDGTADENIDNRFEVAWESGSAVCSARAVCAGAAAEPAPCLPGKSAKRGLGFWKTHVEAARACLSAGPIDLGIVTVEDLEALEGLFWGSPPKFASGQRRGELDQKRFLLARELAVALCNVRVLGAQPKTPGLFDEARAVLRGTDCHQLSRFQVRLEHVAVCGGGRVNTAQAFDRADPSLAQSLAADPTRDLGQRCEGPRRGKHKHHRDHGRGHDDDDDDCDDDCGRHHHKHHGGDDC
jgi:hypothetical protein